jgi:WD40 repeat protein
MLPAMTSPRKKLWFSGLALACAAVIGIARGGEEGPPRGEPLPKGALRRLGTTKFRAGNRVLSLAYFPNDRWLVSGGGNGPVLVWDTGRGQHKAPLTDNWVYAVAFAPGGKVMATGGGFKVIRLWDLDANKEIAQLPAPGSPGQASHKGTVRALAFSPDGKWLVSASDDHTIKIWEIQTKRERRSLRHDDEVTCLAFLGDGKTFASGGGDRTIRLWDVEDGTAKGSLPADGAVTCLAAHGDSLASGSDDNIVRVWDAAGTKVKHTLPGHKGAVQFVGFADDGKTLVSCGADREVRRWDAGTGNATGSFKYRDGDGDAFALSHDGKRLACAGINGVVCEYDVATGKELVPTPGHHGGVTGVVFSADGKKVASASGERVRVWQADNGNTVGDFPTGKRQTDLILLFSHDGNTLIGADGQGAIHLWDLAQGGDKATIPGPAGSSIFTAALSPDGKTLAAGTEKHGIRLITLEDRKAGPEVTLKYPGFVTHVAFSADGKYLAATGKGKIIVYELPGGTEKTQIGPAGASSCVAFSPNVPLLFSGGYDGLIHMWDLRNGKETKQIEGSGGAILALTVSPDGQTLLTGGMDKTVRVWEVASGQEVLQWKGHDGTVPCVGFGPKGRTAVSGSADTTALVWDATGRLKDGTLPAMNLEAGELKNLWDDLASTDMRKAHAAFWLLTSAPGQAVPLFEKNVFRTNPKFVDQMISDLDSIKFAVREKATITLENMGRWVEDPLKKALEGNPNIEVRRRLELILQRITKEGGLSMDQEYWRIGRIIGVLEQDASAESRRMLQLIAEGAAAAHLREMANVALRRLDRGANP